MMSLTVEKVNVDNKDFLELIGALDNELHQLYGELQKSFDGFNTTQGLETVVVIYDQNIPIACGAYKQYCEDTIEVKRVYVMMQYRKQGISQKLMRVLELDALQKGYSKAVLETGTLQHDAVKSYQKRGYQICDPYEPYVNNVHSICMSKSLKRCFWAGDEKIYQDYHDYEWGVPVHDDRKLFEMLILEGAQAGLSWITILKRREGYRQVFDHFDWKINAAYTDEELEEKLLDSRIIRNRLKVFSVRSNAVAFQKVQDEFGSFDAFIWSFVEGKSIDNKIKERNEILATSSVSDAISKVLKKRGFKFVGSTIVYAYMQAIGMVNDHFTDCVCR